MRTTTTKNCARCQKPFEPRNKNQRYCNDPCNWTMHSREQQVKARQEAAAEAAGLDHLPTPEEEQLARRVIGLEARSSRKDAEVRASRRMVEEVREELEQTRTELALLSTETVAPDWLNPPDDDDGEHHGTLVAVFSDSHYGEVVEPAEMVGYNAYNMDIARKRTRRFFERTILVARQYLAGVTYDGVVMPMLGDIVSGDIHDEFRDTNELTTYETILEIVPWIEAGMYMLLEEFGSLHVPAVPGNHPRNSRKPRYKKRSANNADTLITRMLANKFKDVDGVTFDVPDAFSADFRIYDTAFRCEHGDEAKGGGGIQGALLPITLRTHRVRKQAQAEGAPFEVLLLGHWHQLMMNPAKGFVVNGSLKGYDEFARGKGFEPEPPQQALMVVTPEHGISMHAPLFVADRNDEGW